MSAYLSTNNWLHLFTPIHPLDVESLWQCLKNKICNAINLYVPLKPNFSDSTACKSYPSFIRRALNKKRALWRKRFSLLGKAAYKAQANKCDRLVRKYHAATERRILNSNSSVALFRHVNRKFASCYFIPPFRNVATGVTLVTNAEKADAFNNYFASVFKQDDNPYTADLAAFTVPVSNDIDFSIVSVHAALRQTKHCLFSSPDFIPSIFWAKTASAIALNCTNFI